MLKIVLLILTAYLALVALLFIFQRNILFVPGKSAPLTEGSLVPEAEDISLRTTDGLILHSWFFKGKKAKPLILYFQGNTGTIADRDKKASHFLDLGYSFLFVGYRGYGGNSGTPSEKGFNLDANAAIAFAISEGFNSNEIVLYGESLGTGVAINLAQKTRVLSVILEAPYTSIAKVASERYWFVPVDYLLKDRFDSISKIKDLNIPLLILHGDKDQVIDLKHGKELFEQASEPKYMHIFKGANHSNLYDYNAIDVVDSFLVNKN